MLHTFPDAPQIVEAVRDFLRDEVVVGTEGRLSFRARVAANLLDTLARELADTSEGEQRLRDGLARLESVDEGALALRIRSGSLDHEDPVLRDLLLSVTRDRLRVSHPGYLSPDIDDDPRTAP